MMHVFYLQTLDMCVLCVMGAMSILEGKQFLSSVEAVTFSSSYIQLAEFTQQHVMSLAQQNGMNRLILVVSASTGYISILSWCDSSYIKHEKTQRLYQPCTVPGLLWWPNLYVSQHTGKPSGIDANYTALQ